MFRLLYAATRSIYSTVALAFRPGAMFLFVGLAQMIFEQVSPGVFAGVADKHPGLAEGLAKLLLAHPHYLFFGIVGFALVVLFWEDIPDLVLGWIGLGLALLNAASDHGLAGVALLVAIILTVVAIGSVLRVFLMVFGFVPGVRRLLPSNPQRHRP